MSLLLVCDSVGFSSNSSIILCDNNNVNTAKILHNITFLSYSAVPNDVFNSIFTKRFFNSTFKRLNVTILAKM